jgi:hypothetical protein
MNEVERESDDEVAAWIFAHWAYDPDTGLIHGRGGRPIGTVRQDGALQALSYPGEKPVSVLLHRAAWLLRTGRWPEFEIDHEDGDRANNRWRNLRGATKAQNQQNRSPANRLGRLIGCTPYFQKWKAQLRVDGVVHYLGLFDTEKQAHEAYCAAKVKLHTFNPKQRIS